VFDAECLDGPKTAIAAPDCSQKLQPRTNSG
jgi:hypothetical protein